MELLSLRKFEFCSPSDVKIAQIKACSPFWEVQPIDSPTFLFFGGGESRLRLKDESINCTSDQGDMGKRPQSRSSQGNMSILIIDGFQIKGSGEGGRLEVKIYTDASYRGRGSEISDRRNMIIYHQPVLWYSTSPKLNCYGIWHKVLPTHQSCGEPPLVTKRQPAN